MLVSIHAPTWGATQDETEILSPHLFQSTHPHGVRPFRRFYTIHTDEFQSTHPHGVRLPCFVQQNGYLTVSIHAPTWGATLVLIVSNKRAKFQSTHPHGVRQIIKD